MNIIRMIIIKYIDNNNNIDNYNSDNTNNENSSN